jgi:predicted DsbA family dithiol-disulfide isomerase
VIELKRTCPFCITGTAEIARKRLGNDYVNVAFAARCRNLACGAEGPSRKTEEEAALAWETRGVSSQKKRSTDGIPEKNLEAALQKGKPWPFGDTRCAICGAEAPGQYGNMPLCHDCYGIG